MQEREKGSERKRGGWEGVRWITTRFTLVSAPGRRTSRCQGATPLSKLAVCSVSTPASSQRLLLRLVWSALAVVHSNGLHSVGPHTWAWGAGPLLKFLKCVPRTRWHL